MIATPLYGPRRIMIAARLGQFKCADATMNVARKSLGLCVVSSEPAGGHDRLLLVGEVGLWKDLEAKRCASIRIWIELKS